jgi:hypothetical protein
MALTLPFLNNTGSSKQPAYSGDGAISLVIGSKNGIFTLHAHEIPEELDGLGGTQLLAVHNFPGGSRTVQPFGFFPVPVMWEGWLFPLFGNAQSATDQLAVVNGVAQNIGKGIVATALDRYQDMKDIANAGSYVTVAWGSETVQGYVEELKILVKNQFRLRYRFKMVVTADISNIQNSADQATQRQVLQSWSNKLQKALTNPALPTDLSKFGSALQTSMTALLLRYDPKAATLFSNVVNEAGSLSGVCSSYINGSNSPSPDGQSMALGLNSIASGVTSAIQSFTSVPIAAFQAINPNFFSLAAQHYGDASQATTLAQANGQTDPQPIGVLPIIIPPPNLLLPLQPVSAQPGG